ncbi:6,7-dimethyl-8-ribityllumazine synthase [Larsenimonas rhizosphaerae]|uniref:6,7-dimethyl-8-ribityllumazine synthase n=1 Tax=Larsenimonas rhizosphaerae TaxID=2944682 RepID=A0AA41ZG77_9GAMM|nr:6,7-dimethyl-8-ribityllumazine synthase [Larsenimonas rhizosphaerae]MCX2523589.1 6,7-dimethyl-8-ribityllumazine synthase [Larsenimonas rhizosphaerae]
MNQSSTSPSSHARQARIGFIQAGWHEDIVSRAREGFEQRLVALGLQADQIEDVTVPGVLEIPLQARLMADTGRYDLLVAAGFIVDGGIYRHDFVSSTVIDALMRVQLDTHCPILSVVLTPHHFQESSAHLAFFKEHFIEKGAEAAGACIMTLNNQTALTR